MEIMCCMKIVEKDRFRTRDISGHSLGREDGASRDVQLRAQDALTPDGPGQVFCWIVEVVFNGHFDSSLFLLLV